MDFRERVLHKDKKVTKITRSVKILSKDVLVKFPANSHQLNEVVIVIN
jgi:hypothetical protein